MTNESNERRVPPQPDEVRVGSAVRAFGHVGVVESLGGTGHGPWREAFVRWDDGKRDWIEMDHLLRGMKDAQAD